MLGKDIRYELCGGVRWRWDGGEGESGYECGEWDVLASISTCMIIVEKKVTN